MLLDDLVTAIQTVQQRIREHGNSLSQNEYRTRISLIDPILNALGWDVSDPKLVTPEYHVGSGRADYALLGEDGKPQAFIEAKRLGEMAEASRHETQLFTYAVTQGVRYAALTDGNRWIFDNLSARFSGGESRLLDVTISKELAHQCALKFLLLWHPTLAAGHPLEAGEPILDKSSETPTPSESADPQPLIQPQPIEWTPLSEYGFDQAETIPSMWFPDVGEIKLERWSGILVEIAEWLVRSGDLTAPTCPIPNKAGGVLVNVEPKETSGKPIGIHHKLSNGLTLKTHGNLFTLLSGAKILLGHFGKDPTSILLKPSQ